VDFATLAEIALMTDEKKIFASSVAARARLPRSFTRHRLTCDPKAVTSPIGVAASHPDKARYNSACSWCDRARWDLLVSIAISAGSNAVMSALLAHEQSIASSPARATITTAPWRGRCLR
jgi:hypothetical protein